MLRGFLKRRAPAVARGVHVHAGPLQAPEEIGARLLQLVAAASGE